MCVYFKLYLYLCLLKYTLNLVLFMCSQFMLYFRFYKFVSNWMLYNHVQYRAKSTQLIHTYYFHDYVCVYNHINFYLILFSAFAFFARSLHLLLRVCEILWFGCFFWLRTFFLPSFWIDFSKIRIFKNEPIFIYPTHNNTWADANFIESRL